jgi:hypothetical protein
VVNAACIVLARRGCTLVYLVLAVGATEPWWTLARVALGSITAGPSMSAGLVVTSLGRRLTVRAMPALRALAAVATCSIVLETQIQSVLFPSEQQCIVITESTYSPSPGSLPGQQLNITSSQPDQWITPTNKRSRLTQVGSSKDSKMVKSSENWLNSTGKHGCC